MSTDQDGKKTVALQQLLSVTDAPVHLISTPYVVPAGAAMAQAVKDENHDPPHKFCYNPNSDAPQDAGGGWLSSWIEVCGKTKESSGTVYIVYNSEKTGAFGEGVNQGYFDGQAQQGEYKLATQLGCNIEWRGYARDLEAEKQAANEAEKKRIAAGGCVVGGDHKWQYHQGTDGTGRACFKCLEVQDLATGQAIWWCSTPELRQRVLEGGCPADGAHAWAMQNGGRCCTKCGQTETSSGEIKMLPQLIGAFGPPKANPRVANR